MKTHQLAKRLADGPNVDVIVARRDDTDKPSGFATVSYGHGYDAVDGGDTLPFAEIHADTEEPCLADEPALADTPMTKLPDGSGCFTATIMSKEEAMALPVRERPLCFRISSEMYHAVFEAIGEASMCWNPRPSNEVFAPEQASAVATRLCFKIAEELEKRGDWCGCAGQVE